MGLTLGYSLKVPNNGDVLGYFFGSMDGMIFGMYLENTLGPLIESIWNINWYGTGLGDWKHLWQFNWVPYLLLS